MARLLPLILYFIYSVSSAQLMIAAKEKGKKYGYIDEKGNYLIQPQYDDAEPFYDGYAVVKQGKKWGVINTKNEFVLKPEYEDANGMISEGKVILKKDKFLGVVEIATGKEIVPFIYNAIAPFNEGYVIASQLDCIENPGPFVEGSKAEKKLLFCSFVIINQKGEIVQEVDNEARLPLEELSLTKVRGGTIMRRVQQEAGLYPIPYNVEKKSNVQFSSPEGWPIFGEMNPDAQYRSGLMNVQLDSISAGYFGNPETLEENGAIWRNSDLKFKLSATEVHPFFNGVAVIVRNGKLSFIDDKGNTITDTQLDASVYDAGPPMYFNGLIGLFKTEGKKSLAGYVDLKGNTVIPFQFDEYHPFEYEVTTVKFKGKFGLIKKDGTWALQPKYEMLDLGSCPCYR